MIRAWMTTRIVSPTPLSDFVPDVTLIAFPIPLAIARGVAEHLLRAKHLISRRENGLDSDIWGESRRWPNPPRFEASCGVLDRCARARNQWRRQNLLIL